MSYKPHNRLVPPARQKSGVFRLTFGLTVTILLYAFLLALGSYALKLTMGNAWVGDLAAPGGVLTPGQTLTILGSFSFLIIAIGLVVILVHHRNPIAYLAALHLPTHSFFSQCGDW